MKVWELMSILSDVPAGQDVLVSLPGTLNTEVRCATTDEGDFVVIEGEDTNVANDDGDDLGLLSDVIANCQPSED